jgi:hypothetical protein
MPHIAHVDIETKRVVNVVVPPEHPRDVDLPPPVPDGCYAVTVPEHSAPIGHIHDTATNTFARPLPDKTELYEHALMRYHDYGQFAVSVSGLGEVVINRSNLELLRRAADAARSQPNMVLDWPLNSKSYITLDARQIIALDQGASENIIGRTRSFRRTVDGIRNGTVTLNSQVDNHKLQGWPKRTDEQDAVLDQP